jgi:hypothetical protein
MIEIPKVIPVNTPVEGTPIDGKTRVSPVPVEEKIPTDVKKPQVDRRKNPDRRKSSQGRDKPFDQRHRDRRRSNIDISI